MASYTGVNAEAFRRNDEIAQSRRSGSFQETWRPQVGPAGTPKRNVIRIMQPHVNMEGDPFASGKMHFLPSRDIGKDGRPVPIGVNCLSEWGEECPACVYVDGLYREAKAADDPEEAARIRKNAGDQSAKTRILCNIIDMDHPDKGVQRFAFSPDMEKKLRLCFRDDDLNFRDITDQDTGRDIILTGAYKSGTTGFIDYQARAKESSSKLRDKDWLEAIADVGADLKKKPSRDDIQAALRGERTKGALPQSGAAEKPAPKPEVSKPVAAAPAAAPKPVAVPKAAAAPKPAPVAASVAEAPAPVVAEAPAPVADAPAPAASRPKRQAVQEDAGDPWAAARAACAEAGFTEPTEITVDQAEKQKKPQCFATETDIGDQMCQGCRVLLPCLTLKLQGAVAA